MTSQQISEKKGKKLSEMIVVIVLVSVLMSSFIFYFFKYKGQLTQVGFESVSYVFSARVNGIRAKWFMDAQPNYVAIENSFSNENTDNIMVPVNRLGWVDVNNSTSKCKEIWQYIMVAPLVYINQPIGAVLVETKGVKAKQYCQYSLPSGEHFTYQSGNGRVDFK